MVLLKNHRPVDDFPAVRDISHNLYGDEHFLFDVDNAYHLVQVLPRVCKELLHL